MWLKILNLKPAKKKAQALILAYMVIASLVVLLLPLLHKIFNENLILNRQRLQREASYYAEGGIEDGINWFISRIANFQSNFATPVPINYVSNYANGINATVTIDSFNSQAGIIDPDGTNVIVRPYIFNSTCQHPLNANIRVTVKQIVAIRLTSAFQYAVFYNDDLEVFPGKPMIFNGRIFSNKDIYLGSDGSTLTVGKSTVGSAYLRGAADVYNVRKDGGTNSDGKVNIEVAGSTGPSYVSMYKPGFPYPDHLDSTDADWLYDAQAAWNGTVQTSANGVTKKAVPVVGSIAANNTGYYYNIVNNTGTGILVINGTIKCNGNMLTQGAVGVNKIPNGTIITSNNVSDGREGFNISMTTIDLKKLAGADGGYANYTNYLKQNANGLIYATNGNTHPGVRLKNGSQIFSLASGLTVVTNDPLYIQGDYNNVTKVPSAVICDSVNLLSNNWQDGNSSKTIDKRSASETTINTAFIAGVDTTIPNSDPALRKYNGGLENYPRLLEDWSGKNLNICGSFVELWNTQIAQGKWPNTGTIYNPPNRVWTYDTNLANTPPPFTPLAVEAQRGARWKE